MGPEARAHPNICRTCLVWVHWGAKGAQQQPLVTIRGHARRCEMAWLEMSIELGVRLEEADAHGEAAGAPGARAAPGEALGPGEALEPDGNNRGAFAESTADGAKAGAGRC